MSKNFIVCAAFGYSAKDISFFLDTLQDTNFDGTVILLTDPNTNLLNSSFPRFDVKVLKIARLPSANIRMSCVWRFFLIKDLIHDGLDFDTMLLTDIRDVAFQIDPFACKDLNKYNILFALEDRRIGDCPYNSNWIRRRFGEGILDALKGEVISCSGTVLGKKEQIKSYVNKMCAHLIDSPQVVGIDQGVHNYIKHFDKIDGQASLINGLGPIMTIQYMNHDKILSSESGMLLNYDGTLPNIIHQFDRIGNENRQRFSILKKSAFYR